MKIDSIAALATGAGTLVLAIATFASTRSANRAARTAELAVQIGQRPLLMPSRTDDPEQKIMFADDHWVHVRGGGASVEHADRVVYLVVSLRNVGPGVAVIQGWIPYPERVTTLVENRPIEDFRTHTRDLYIPPGDIGLWQGALRDANESDHAAFAASIDERGLMTVDLLYSDVMGRQRTITRFAIAPVGETAWVASAIRHWMLDAPNPR